MAKNNPISIDLQLPEYPDSIAIPKEMFDTFLSAYTALQALAAGADALGGIGLGDDINVTPSDDKRVSCVYDRLSSFQVKAAQSMDYGYLVELRSDGQAYRAVPRQLDDFPGLGPAFRRQRSQLMCVTPEVKVGDTITVCYKGILGAAGAIGTILYNITASQSETGQDFSGRLTTSPPFSQVPFPSGVTAGVFACSIGTNAFLFDTARV